MLTPARNSACSAKQIQIQFEVYTKKIGGRNREKPAQPVFLDFFGRLFWRAVSFLTLVVGFLTRVVSLLTRAVGLLTRDVGLLT